MENPFRLSVFMMACLPWLALLLLTTCWRCSLATSDDEWEDSWGTSWSSPANVETSSSSPGPSSSISSWMAAPASSWDDPSWMAAPASSWDDPSWPASSTSSSMPSSSSWSHAEFVDWMSAAWDEEISLAAQLQIWHGEAAVQRDESGVDFVGTTNAAPEPDDLPLPFSPSMASSSPSMASSSPCRDWLEAVVDKRVLRGGRRLGCAPTAGPSTWSSTASPSTSSSSLCRPCPLPSSSSSPGATSLGTSSGCSVPTSSSSLESSSPGATSSVASDGGAGNASSCRLKGLRKDWVFNDLHVTDGTIWMVPLSETPCRLSLKRTLPSTRPPPRLLLLVVLRRPR